VRKSTSVEYFVKTLKELREEIEKLGKEKASLFEEIEDLRARGETTANRLRDEVDMLRREVDALKGAINDSES
jgi:predicted  nucleic acid-binding Zn-ribbon protein